MQKLLKKAAFRAQNSSLELYSALSLSSKFNFGQFRQTLNLFVMMFVLFSSPFSVDAQRIRYGYEWPCWETPPPPTFPPTGDPVPPTLCERMKDAFNGKTISIGAGTQFPTSKDLIQQFGQVVLNQNIFVTGDFEVNESIIFRGCKLSVSKDKSIIVEGGNQLYSQRSKFFSCEGMWNGIYMNPKANLFLSQETEIEDAYKAVYATPEAGVLRINSTTFNRNQVGIFLEDKDKTGAVVNIAQFYNNKFDCTSELAIADFYRWSVAGIWTNTVSVPTLGTPSTNSNLFTGKIRTGIHSINSILTISNSRFVRIDRGLDNTLGEAPYMGVDLTIGIGYGIYASDRGGIKVEGLGKNFDTVPTYENCAGGFIYTNDVRLEVQNALVYSITIDNKSNDATKSLVGTERIIHSSNNTTRQDINISNNYFKIYDHVVVISVHKSIGKIKSISDNKFKFEAGKNVGIVTSNIEGESTMIQLYNANASSFIPFTPALIENNEINVVAHDFKVRGIHVDGSLGNSYSDKTDQNVIAGNVINDFCGNIGIKIEKACNSIITRNIIHGYSLDGHISGIGIQLEGTLANPALNNTICNNELDYLDYGIICKGFCNESQISENHIERVQLYGLLLKDSEQGSNFFPYAPVIGSQWKSVILNGDTRKATLENYWDWKTQSPTFAAKSADAAFISSIVGANPSLSQFLIDKKNPTYPQTPQTIKITTSTPFTPSDWFVPSSPYITYQPFGCAGGNKPSTETGEWTVLDESILNEEYGFHLKVTAWEAKRYLFEKLTRFPSLLENENRMNFYKKMQNTSVSEYEYIKNKIDNAFDIDANLSAELDDLRTTREAELQKVKEIITAFNTEAGDGDWDIIGTEVIRAQAKPIIALNEKINAIEKAIDTERMERLQKLAAEIENLSVTTDYEKAYKTVYAIWTKAAIQNAYLNEEDLSQIRIIAHECITRLGSSVLIARDLLPECEKYDDECPDTIEPDWIKAVKNKNQSTFYPNPTDNTLTINTKDIEYVHAITINSIEGKLLKKINTEIGNTNYNCTTSDLNNGLYLIQFLDAKSKILSAHKLIVQH